jgi:hypothetical protein
MVQDIYNAWDEKSQGKFDQKKASDMAAKILGDTYDQFSKQGSGSQMAKPTQDDISYLVAHPELKSKFESKFGAGSADQYLTQ